MAGADNYVIVRSNGVEKSLRTWMLDELLVDAVAIPDVHIPANVLVVGDDLVSDSNPLPVYLTSGDISTYVDGLETLLGTSNTALSAISSTLSNVSGFVDGLETLLGTTNSTLGTVNSSITTLAGYVDQMEGYNDGVETLLGTVNTNLTTLIGHNDGIEALLAGTLIVGGAVADDAAASGNPLAVGGRYTATRPTFTDGDRAELRLTTKGELNVASAQEFTGTDGYSNTLGYGITNGGSGRLNASAPYVFNGTTWDRVTCSNATARLVSSAASVNSTNVKNSAGKIFQILAFNTHATDRRYLKIYNKASAPTVGTDTPILTYPIPPGGGLVVDFPQGHYCSLGIGYGLTTAAADASTAAVGAGDVECVNIAYA